MNAKSALTLLGLFVLTCSFVVGESEHVDAVCRLYDADPHHLWNRLHVALFMRSSQNGSQQLHRTDPLLFKGNSKFLIEAESYLRAISVLDEFLERNVTASPVKRLFLQRDLWAAFDYLAWVADDWVHDSKHEPAAIAVRSRLAKAIAKLALSDREMDALPNNFDDAIRNRVYPTMWNPDSPGKAFLPSDLLDSSGVWVPIFENSAAKQITQEHFAAVGGRASHTVLLNLPGGREQTLRYLEELNGDNYKQFPEGTIVALLRRVLTIDQQNKIRITPVIEGLQIRVYRQISKFEKRGNVPSSPEDQVVSEIVLDRSQLFVGYHGLRIVEAEEQAQPFARDNGDPFERPVTPSNSVVEESSKVQPARQLQTCLQCHAGPGIYSVISMRRGLERTQRVTRSTGELVALHAFNSYTLDVAAISDIRYKLDQFDWGLLQGQLEAGR